MTRFQSVFSTLFFWGVCVTCAEAATSKHAWKHVVKGTVGAPGDFGILGVDGSSSRNGLGLHLGVGLGPTLNGGLAGRYHFQEFDCGFIPLCSQHFFLNISYSRVLRRDISTSSDGMVSTFRLPKTHFSGVSLGHSFQLSFLYFDIQAGYRFADSKGDIEQTEGEPDLDSQKELSQSLRSSYLMSVSTGFAF